MQRIIILMAFVGLLPVRAGAVELFDNFPANIHADERYVIYSHGFIVEGDDPRPSRRNSANMISRPSNGRCSMQAAST
jgi:hypothetical protein